MNVETAWVTPPHAIGGLDHLGTQAPCVLIYSQLLPGITNVTDRARYYSFYPWLVWSFERRYPNAGLDAFVEFYRRADCLFTLIAERHARATDRDDERHGAAMVGRIQLTQALDRLDAGTPLRLSHYTASDSEHRYFKNQLGGLGQYYAGTLADLQLMDPSSKPWMQFTFERGQPIAEGLDRSVPGDELWKVVDKDEVTLADLDGLAAFCPCHLKNAGDERQSLTDIFLDRRHEYEGEGDQRRKSLGLILHLADSLRRLEGPDLSELVFRACVYSGSLPGQEKWVVPESLRGTRECWSLYQRNDLLSVACQTVLAVGLRELQPHHAAPARPPSVEAFARSLSLSAVGAKVCAAMQAESFGELVARLAADGPPRDNWEQQNHEVSLVEQLIVGWNRNESTVELLEGAIRVLALLASRDNQQASPYGTLAIPPEALSDYPINLASFRERCVRWRPQAVSAFLADLIQWCLNTHLRVALRKLRQTGRSTFHLRPSERGLEVVGEIPPPAHTVPRFRQAVQILRDIGALSRNADRTTMPSEMGTTLLEEACV